MKFLLSVQIRTGNIYGGEGCKTKVLGIQKVCTRKIDVIL